MFFVAAWTAPAAIYDLAVDAAESPVEIAPSSFDGLDFVPAEPQGSNSLRTRFSGTIRLEITNNTARLLSGSELILENNGDWQPGPFTYDPSNPRAFNTNTGPANYAYRYVVPFEFFVAVRHLRFNLSSEQAAPYTGQTFPSAGTVVTIPEGYGDLTLGNPPQSNLATYPSTITTGAGDAVLAESAGAVTLTLPLHFEWQLAGAVTIHTVYDGVVVARAGAAPLPELSLEPLPDGKIKLSWPSAVTGYALATAADLSAGVWTPVGALPVTEADRQAVTLAPAGSPQFFRLQPL
ncbi:MAG: hypothetical protein KIT22_16690 [Verrucomicrobiae bacterium]|nr:hypothetical protein [Verrucomicrobiae bacterium]